MENAEMKLSESESMQLIISIINRAKNCVGCGSNGGMDYSWPFFKK